MTFTRIAAGAILALALTGCASMQSHNEATQKVEAARHQGGIPAALQQLDAAATTDSERASLLYNLEKGELLRLNQQIPESTESFLKADAKVQEWEGMAKTNPDKLIGMIGASLISDRLKTYEGHDYEKVWLTTRLALNRLAMKDADNARVDIKRTHEREAVIAELRSKDVAAAEEEAKAKGAEIKSKELNGYPVETLNDPEVLKLKNGYSNALSHYLAGFLYEVLNEPGLAAPGYRKAIELKPDTKVLDEGLRGLDGRTSFVGKRKQKQTDVLFIVEAGTAPARVSKAFTIPIVWNGHPRTISISYPVIEPSRDPLLSSISLGNKPFALESVVDLNVMARRELKEEMGWMIVRNATRAIAKFAVQQEVEKKTGLLGGLIASAVSAYTEQADDRMWRQLPGRVYLARGFVEPGEYSLNVAGRETSKINISGQYAVVPLRVYDDSLIVGGISSFGALPTLQPAAATSAPATSTDAVEKPVTKPTKKKKPQA